MKSSDVKALYDATYFLSAVDGHDQFDRFDGSAHSLFHRYARNLEFLDLRAEHSLLDVGCGRGELCIYHALRGGVATGVDFSREAVAIAREKASALCCDAKFVNASFEDAPAIVGGYDRIIASEFIEHISKEEGKRFFEVARGLLSPDGLLVVHTMPNTLQRTYGYPLQRAWSVLKRNPLPKKQADTDSEHYRSYHLNEQSYFSLMKLAREGGFDRISVSYDHGQTRSSSLIRRAGQMFVNSSPLRHIFCNHLYLRASK